MRVAVEVVTKSRTDGCGGVFTIVGDPQEWSWHVEATGDGYAWEDNANYPDGWEQIRAALAAKVCTGGGKYGVSKGQKFELDVPRGGASPKGA